MTSSIRYPAKFFSAISRGEIFSLNRLTSSINAGQVPVNQNKSMSCVDVSKGSFNKQFKTAPPKIITD
jgi:hypothetical protein